MNYIALQGRALPFLFFCLVSTLSSCSSEPKIVQIRGNTMGTYYSVKYVNDFPSLSESQVKAEVEKILSSVNKEMSTYISTSEISVFNKLKKGESLKLSPDFSKVLNYSLELSKKTEGLFDPTVGPLVNLWGFGPKRTMRAPEQSKISEALKNVGLKHIKIKEEKKTLTITKKRQGVYLDLSATAKGFAVDKISEMLKAQQLSNHLVDIGGELRASGSKNKTPWKIAIESPTSKGNSINKILNLKNTSVATSGSYRNYFTDNGINYNHTIDPKTGESVIDSLVSASVLSTTCMDSDGMATALMAMGFEKAKTFIQKNKLRVYLISYSKEKEKFTTYISPNFE